MLQQDLNANRAHQSCDKAHVNMHISTAGMRAEIRGDLNADIRKKTQKFAEFTKASSA